MARKFRQADYEATFTFFGENVLYKQERNISHYALGLLSLIAAVALYQSTTRWLDTPDGWIHLHRIQALAEALQMGKWFPRWFPDFSFGYGYPVLHFYAPAFYYPPALLTAFGLDAFHATRIVLAIVYAISGFAMGMLLGNWVTSVPMLVGTIVYLTFPYRFYDLFVRGALPEFAAFLWLPLICHFLYQFCLFQNRMPWLFAGALFWSALILTHNLSALMVLIVIVLALPLAGLVLQTPPERNRITLLIGLGWRMMMPLLLGLLLSAWYWLPALWDARWVGIGANRGAAGYLNHFADWNTLFAWDVLYRYPPASSPIVPLPGWLGIVLVLMLLLLIIAPPAREVRQLIVVSAILLLFCGWLTMRNSAWLWHFTDPVLGKLQFPWRWQTIMALAAGGLVAGVTALIEAHLRQRIRSIRNPAMWLLALLPIYFTAAAANGLRDLPSVDEALKLTLDALWATDAQLGQVGASWTGEFLPQWVTEQRWAIGRAPSAAQSSNQPGVAHETIHSLQVEKVGYDNIRYTINNTAQTELIFHQFYFPAWQVRIDNQTVASTPLTNLGLLSFQVQPGNHQIEIKFGATPAVWLGRVLTLLGLLAALGMTLYFAPLYFAPIRRAWLLFWICCGLLAFGVVASVGEVAIYPAKAQVVYEDVRLIAAEIPPTQAGTTAEIRLHWLIQSQSQALTVFIHLVNNEGVVVTQFDNPLAGIYTPFERWQPGLLLRQAHPLLLPADLAPGNYDLLLGVYRPGEADKPLLTVDGSGPRTSIGTIEVKQ